VGRSVGNIYALNPDFEVARLRFEAFEYAQAEEMCATSRFPDEVYRDLLNDDDRQHVDGCITAMAVEQGTTIPTFLIDPASLDVVPTPEAPAAAAAWLARRLRFLNISKTTHVAEDPRKSVCEKLE
jgi:hypothetical protein